MACVRYFKTLHEMTGVNIIESGKHTAASLAAHASQTYLTRGKFPAQFSPNSVWYYSILKQSCIGAQCTVMRTRSGGEDTEPINGHFKTRPETLASCCKGGKEEAEGMKFEYPARYCQMIDVNSLYPSSW